MVTQAQVDELIAKMVEERASLFDAVATVSSCARFPWMMEVNSLRVCASTAFHTLETQGQVVSTM